MAKVSNPLHSSEARGAVGAQVYNTWRGLHIVKTRSGPTITQSADQLALRAITAQYSQRWATLTDSQRNAWSSFANSHPDTDWTGHPKRLSGFNWFIRINVRLQLAQNDFSEYPPSWWIGPRDDPPSDFDFFNWHISSTYESSGETISIDWDYPYHPDPPWAVECYLAGPYSVGRNPTIKQADRKLALNISDYYFCYETISPGRYHFFLRCINAHGITDNWQRAYVDHT